ncbi:MAG: hypothetical protein RLY87_340 [Chloroflexota bacterium]
MKRWVWVGLVVGVLVISIGSAASFWVENAPAIAFVQAHPEVPFDAYAKSGSAGEMRELIRHERANQGLFSSVLAHEASIDVVDRAIERAFYHISAYDDEVGIEAACVYDGLPCVAYRMELASIRNEPQKQRDNWLSVWVGTEHPEPLIMTDLDQLLLDCALSPTADLSVCIDDTDRLIRAESKYTASIDVAIAMIRYGLLKSIQEGTYTYATFSDAVHALHADPLLGTAISTDRVLIERFRALPKSTQIALAADAKGMADALTFVRQHPNVAALFLRAAP